jgi:hypothetical protein
MAGAAHGGNRLFAFPIGELNWLSPAASSASLRRLSVEWHTKKDEERNRGKQKGR